MDSLKRKQSTDFGLVQQGICPECAGNVSPEIGIVVLAFWLVVPFVVGYARFATADL